MHSFHAPRYDGPQRTKFMRSLPRFRTCAGPALGVLLFDFFLPFPFPLPILGANIPTPSVAVPTLHLGI